MQFELNEDQSLLLDAVGQFLRRLPEIPNQTPSYTQYDPELQHALFESGFLSVCATEGYGALEGALVVDALARSPWALEAAASTLVAVAAELQPSGPVAHCEGLGRPTRFLAQARHALIQDKGLILVADLEPGQAQARHSVLAYPIGVLTEMPSNARALSKERSEDVLLRWRIGLAAEAAGLMRAALDLTLAHVRDRFAFGRPLADLQAIQHRLAVAEQLVAATRLLTLRAADTLAGADAATAALYAQEQMRRIIYDCHQFSGAMGVTLEYHLHLWTYRLKFIQGELGGRAAQAEALAGAIY